jgi:hypothetical protein
MMKIALTNGDDHRGRTRVLNASDGARFFTRWRHAVKRKRRPGRGFLRERALPLCYRALVGERGVRVPAIEAGEMPRAMKP